MRSLTKSPAETFRPNLELSEWTGFLFYLSSGDASKYESLKRMPLRLLYEFYYLKKVSELNELLQHLERLRELHG
ncbi:MAG TPA: hypothetical protein VHO28_05405 [Ignavibacteriales bacterium]|nr:hypothetical protein [Ignavibacteriales bacterium]HEX3075103.1 hypothetical protein [Ignavibacteriales bacterium]